MYADIAVAKISKYATSESGDTVELIERPHGGISVVMADGQRSGRSAKAISNIVTRKVVSLLGEGARDGVATRAAHDYLFAMRRGKVRADLQLVTLDLESRTLVISRNTDCGALLIEARTVRWLDAPSTPIGLYRGTRPVISEVPVEAGRGVVFFTDGVTRAGSRSGDRFDVAGVIEPLLHQEGLVAAQLADVLLERARAADGGFPRDDLTVAVLLLHPTAPDSVRRLNVRFPLE